MPRLVLRAALAVAAGLAGPPALAQQSLDTRYTARLAGVPIGEARVRGTVAGSSYRMQVSGTYGVLGFRGSFMASAAGAVDGPAAVAPARYEATVEGRRTRRTTLAFAGSRVARAEIEPPLAPDEEAGRVPVRDEHRRGVVDPLSGILAGVLRASGGDPCRGLTPVFSGFSRFDVGLRPGETGSDGSRVCEAIYRPVAGHRADRRVALAGSVIRVVFPPAPAPGGARLPSRIEVPLSVGTLVIDRAT
jgi:hypothetical protein